MEKGGFWYNSNFTGISFSFSQNFIKLHSNCLLKVSSFFIDEKLFYWKRVLNVL